MSCLQIILAFAFSFRIQSFICCYVEGLLEPIPSHHKYCEIGKDNRNIFLKHLLFSTRGYSLRYIGHCCKAKCKINVFRFVPKNDLSLRTFTSVFNNSSHMLQNVRYPSCYPGNNICCKQFANS